MNSPTPYHFIPSLDTQLPEIPADSIVSKTLPTGEDIKTILFGFAPGQELSEHTAARPAILHFLEGEADLTLGNEQFSAQPGTWVHMPPHLPHSIYAKTTLKMLLILL